MPADERDPERPERIASTAREIARLFEARQRHYAERAQDFGYAKDIFDSVTSTFSAVRDAPLLAKTEEAMGKFKDFITLREAEADKLKFDVSSASYALASTATTTASFISSLGISEPVQSGRTLSVPPNWSKDRIDEYARRLEALDAELGKVSRAVWQTFYGGAEDAGRASVFLMRQLYDHFFSLLAPDDLVRQTSFFSLKDGAKPQQVHRKERLRYAASVRVRDKSLGEALDSQADYVLELYEQLNRAHSRAQLNARSTRDLLNSMQAVIEQWIDGIGL